MVYKMGVSSTCLSDNKGNQKIQVKENLSKPDSWMDNNSNTDQLLIERVQQGDRHAFDLLVSKYQHKLMSLVSRYISDYQEAQDVVQETFIKAYKALPKFRGDSAFYTWLYRIGVNTAKNHLAAKGRRPSAGDVQVEDAEVYDNGFRLRNSDSPENLILSSEIEKLIFETLDNMSDELRSAFSLREFEGLSYDEIANIMECPVGTVRSRIFRAREAIDQKIKPLLEDNWGRQSSKR